MEQFAKVTIFAKDKTVQALEHPLARPLLPLIPEAARSHFLSSAEAEALLQDYDSAQHFIIQIAHELHNSITERQIRAPMLQELDNTFDFGNLKRHYVSHFIGASLSREKWLSIHQDVIEGVSLFEVACLVFCGGCEPSIRHQVWPFLLGVTYVIAI